MRTVGLLCLLVGCIVLMLPIINQLAGTHFRLDNREITGGALLCLGAGILALTRRETE